MLVWEWMFLGGSEGARFYNEMASGLAKADSK